MLCVMDYFYYLTIHHVLHATLSTLYIWLHVCSPIINNNNNNNNKVKGKFTIVEKDRETNFDLVDAISNERLVHAHDNIILS